MVLQAAEVGIMDLITVDIHIYILYIHSNYGSYPIATGTASASMATSDM